MSRNWKFLSILSLTAALTITGGCASSEDSASGTDISETGQQVGDAMASIDESGGSSNGSFALMDGAHRTFARIAPDEIHDSWWKSAILPSAYAAACKDTTFSDCETGVRLRNFDSCTIGLATFTGAVTLTFSDITNCTLSGANSYVIRSPSFFVTGRRGATLAVTKSGTEGQKITRGATAGTFTYSNDGIRRKFTKIDGTVPFDFTTQTTSDITVTGTSRASRTLSGGSLRVTNNLTNTYCDFVPSNVTWVSTCNCPTSGSWSGTCSDGTTNSLSITGCGTATLTLGSSSEDVTFDRCYSTSG